MLFLGTKNTNSQTLLVGDFIDLGNVYRRYIKSFNGIKTFNVDDTTISIQQEGVYHLTAIITFVGTETGDASFQLFENGVAIDGAVATESVATATTEFNNVVLDYYILVDKTCILGSPSINSNIQIQLDGIGATISNVVVNIDKVL